MAKSEMTSQSAGKSASNTLRSDDTGKSSKSAGGSALSQRTPGKETSSAAATAASRTLSDGRTSKDSKSSAGSTLTQRVSKKT
jgi:hypothetical protein